MSKALTKKCILSLLQKRNLLEWKKLENGLKGLMEPGLKRFQ